MNWLLVDHRFETYWRILKIEIAYYHPCKAKKWYLEEKVILHIHINAMEDSILRVQYKT